ncbi:MAG: phosphoribosylformylglycinamidine cyclo-ligase [Actinobacteria bacterium]|uniref:Phosphoribosylformylglycinamidine cyclo-ligase n=1 Tax=freshwater metagenome TaxID=449393 RepID=A0A6J5ZYU2_9ZZZZ|nr:phosphoribosylformylglycinamidine cyclo-ligase [Actinomycetota bacterium]
MSDAYAAAGVDTDQSDRAVSALVDVLRGIDLGRPSRSVVRSGHYASVLKISDETAIAMSSDGVGSKLVLAEQANRLETVGIDCIAMNVNDIICVGAEPLAMLDYIAVEQADATALARIGEGLKVGAEQAGIEIPGGEVAVLPELIRGHPSPHGFDLCGTAIGTVDPRAMILGEKIEVGDALIGLPSSGAHSNGYTLARRVLVEDGPGLEATPELLGGATVADALLAPTTIYVKAVLDLISNGPAVHGLAHITGGGLTNLRRLAPGRVGYEISAPLAVPPVLQLIGELGNVPAAEMWEVFNMGCGFVVVVPEAAADDAVSILAAHHPGAARVGSVTADADRTVGPGGIVVGAE